MTCGSLGCTQRDCRTPALPPGWGELLDCGRKRRISLHLQDQAAADAPGG